MPPDPIPTFHSTTKRTDDNLNDLSPALTIISPPIITLRMMIIVLAC